MSKFGILKRLTLIFLIVALSNHSLVFAQKVNLILAADTLDEKIGESDRQDVTNLRDLFKGNIPDRLLDIKTITNYEVQGQKILNIIRNLEVDRSDIIIFYWSGHGGYDSGGHFLKMSMDGVLFRSQIIQAIQRKSPRLAVVITDSCNTIFDSSLFQRPYPAPAEGSPKSREYLSPLFHQLFFKARGLVDINSSSRDEVSVTLDDAGGLFTLALASHKSASQGNTQNRAIIVEPIDNLGGTEDKRTVEIPEGLLWSLQDQRISWKGLLQHVRTRVAVLEDGSPQNQHPAVYSWPSDYNGELYLSLEPGDVVLSINGKKIGNRDDCVREVNQSPGIMNLTVRDRLDGNVWNMQADLSDSGLRFGIEVDNYPSGGALVKEVFQGAEAKRVRVLSSVRGLNRQSLIPGDIILAINGNELKDWDHFYTAIKQSPPEMFLKVQQNYGGVVNLRTKLRSGNGSRSGIVATEYEGPGLEVTQVFSDYPGSDCVRVTEKYWSNGISGDVISLREGDLILTINGENIDDHRDYWNAVKRSGEVMKLTVQRRGGTRMKLRTRIRSQAADSRFGVLAGDHDGQGVIILQVYNGSPGLHCTLE